MTHSATFLMTAAFTLLGLTAALGANAFLDIEASLARAIGRRSAGNR